ncbi:GIY-YIG nuclease family protein [Candidatus Woesebacteria bacterium]|nr:GIY-YIG nuclease family protein [Candidatus Woesebacteria bacterium]
MYYVYIIQDEKNKLYVGYSSNLRQRFKAHLLGSTHTTANFLKPRLIYYEAYESEQLARDRETKLKQYGSSYTGLLKRLGLK